MGLDGKPRAMHVEQSLASIEANTAGTPRLVRTHQKYVVLADCAEFRISRYLLAAGEKLAFRAGEEARLLAVTAGRLAGDGRELALGENVLLPFAGSFDFTATTESTVLVTDHFSSLEK
jgi:mannose-6-phosphate isomerase